MSPKSSGDVPDIIELAQRHGIPLGRGGMRTAFGAGRQDELAVFAFDLMHRDGADLTGLPLSGRRKRLERLLVQSDAPCLHLVRCFDDGAALFIAAERHGLDRGHRLEAPRVTLSLWAIP